MGSPGTTLLYLSTIFLGISAKSNVPALIWDPQSPPGSVPSVPSMQSLSFSAFEKYINEFHADNLILFLQDTLSIEDLTAHVKEYSYLSEWFLDNKALYLPSVEDPSNLVNTLPQKGYHVQKVETGSSLAALDLKESNNLVIVKLPDTKNNNDRSEALRKSDEVMASTLSKIDKLRNFRVIYTAMASSLPRDEEEEVQHTRISRSLKDAADRIEGMHFAACIRVYFRNNMILSRSSSNGGPSVRGPIPETKASNDSGTCQDFTSEIVMKYPEVIINGTSFNKLGLTLDFALNNGDWSLTKAELHANNIGKNAFVPFKVEESGIKGVPHGMSYSCSTELVLSSNKTEEGEIFTLTFPGLQIEAFGLDENKFGPSYDCVGFFTVPIWCGVLATLLASTILLWGLYMLAEVKTMDRFDDPKGTPIVITNVQE